MNAIRNCRRTIWRSSLYKTSGCVASSTLYIRKFLHDDSKDKDSEELPKSITSTMKSKYKVFRDEEAPVILDVNEERIKYLDSIENQREQHKEEEFSDINLMRGIHGVYDIEDLVDILRKERALHIFVVSLPSHINYVDYIVVVTGKSTRHMTALAQIVRKLYKRKMNPSDIIPKIEGETSDDWMALDLGNIALHIFSRSARQIYDLESLWSLGSQYDLAYNKPEDPFIALLQKHSVYLGDLQPADRAG